MQNDPDADEITMEIEEEIDMEALPRPLAPLLQQHQHIPRRCLPSRPDADVPLARKRGRPRIRAPWAFPEKLPQPDLPNPWCGPPPTCGRASRLKPRQRAKAKQQYQQQFPDVKWARLDIKRGRRPEDTPLCDDDDTLDDGELDEDAQMARDQLPEEMQERFSAWWKKRKRRLQREHYEQERDQEDLGDKLERLYWSEQSR